MPNNSPSKIPSREERIFLASYVAEIIWNHHSLGILFAEVLLTETPPNTNRIDGGVGDGEGFCKQPSPISQFLKNRIVRDIFAIKRVLSCGPIYSSWADCKY